MTCAQEIQAARSPQEAMLVLAKHIDAIAAKLDDAKPAAPAADPWGTWEVTDEEINVDLPPVTSERADARRKWAEGKDLHTFFAAWRNAPEEFLDVYAKGGPLWMYYGDRDAVMQMPYEWRRDLVAEIAHDSPEAAHDIGRDILKATTEQQRDYAESLDA